MAGLREASEYDGSRASHQPYLAPQKCGSARLGKCDVSFRSLRPSLSTGTLEDVFTPKRNIFSDEAAHVAWVAFKIPQGSAPAEQTLALVGVGPPRRASGRIDPEQTPKRHHLHFFFDCATSLGME